MTDQKALFSALKKCNQIGKKLSYDGTYIMVSGMMMGYTWQDMDETEARGLCVSFIESKLLNKLDALPYIGLKINGNELYSASQEYEFERFTINSDYLFIEFKATEATEASFNEDFKKYNGKYHMVYKRDIYVKSGSNFNITTVLSLLKIDE